MPTRNQQEVDKESLFMTENYGGLNLESSPLNMPLTDSPSVMNVEIEPSGKVKKRRGSRVVSDQLTYTDIHVPYRLSNGVMVHVVTDGDYIKVLNDVPSAEAFDVLYTSGVCLTRVWTPSNKGNYAPKRSCLVVKEDNTVKFHIFTEGAIPVTLTISEYDGSYNRYPLHGVTSSSNATPLAVSNIAAAEFERAYYIEKGTDYWRKASSIASGTTMHLADEYTLDWGEQSVVNNVGKIVIFGWSWEANCQWRTKKHFIDEIPRFYVVRDVDNIIEMSPEFQLSLANDATRARKYLYDANAGSYIWANNFPAIMSTDLVTDSTSSVFLNTNQTPAISTSLAFEWYPTWGDSAGCGTAYSGGHVKGQPTRLSLGLSHIVWGGLYYTDSAYTIPSTPVNYYIHKIMGIYIGVTDGLLESTMLLEGQDMVYASKYSIQSSGNNWLGYKVSATAGRITALDGTANESCIFYGFIAGAPQGCKTTDTLLTYCPATASLPSSGMLGTKTNVYPTYQGGFARNFVGLYPWIQWSSSVTFSVSTLYQDRVVLAGFELYPSAVVMGNVGTQTQREFNNTKYSNFEVAWADNTVATAPLEIRLSISPDERITSMVQWYDSLFVGTTRKLYRIHGGQNVAVTPTNYFVDTVSSVPCAYNSMVLTADGVVFLSDSGVYRVVIDSSSGLFRTENIGIKIRKALRDGLDKGRLYNGLGRAAYDSINNVLYVLVGDEASLTPRRCFVYYADKESWVEWSLASGYFPATTVSCYDGRVFFTICETNQGITSDTTLGSSLTEFNIDNSHLDMVKTSKLDDVDVNVIIKLPVSKASYTKPSATSGTKSNFSLVSPSTGAGLRTLPVGGLGYTKVTNTTDATVGTEGTDFSFSKNNSLTTKASFQGINDVVQVEVLAETDKTPLYIKSVDYLNVNYHDNYLFSKSTNQPLRKFPFAFSPELTSGTLSNCTRTTGATDPTGGTNAVSYTLTGGTVANYANEGTATTHVEANTPYRFGGFFKHNSGNSHHLRIEVVGVANLTQDWALDTPAVGTSGASVKYALIQTIGNGWYYCSMEWLQGASGADISFKTTALNTDGGTNGTSDGNVTYFAYGCKLDLMSTTRACYLEPDANSNIVIEAVSSKTYNGLLYRNISENNLYEVKYISTWNEIYSITLVDTIGSSAANAALLAYDVPITDIGTYIDHSNLTVNNGLSYRALSGNGDYYDGNSVEYGLAYPSWWLSPAFTRNNITSLKTMRHFYAIFENSSSVQSSLDTEPSWYLTPKVNLAVVQNGSRTGQSSTSITDGADPFDIENTSDAGLDYYRVVYPIDGNFISFQAFVYSFDDGNWELVGYQLETDVSGKTSRKPYD